ncbi:MAG TPA: GNAT family N-acetyltransferase [Acidobacteriaceae bacterium]|jgi:ribosomal protein S18 acetylase RimI-like enzyme
MAEIIRIAPANVSLYRQVRLQALQDSPSAFGNTHARESKLTESDWLGRAANLDGSSRIGFMAIDDGQPCGLVACFRDEQDASRAQVISMWVVPAQRGTGLSWALLEAIRTWSKSCGTQTLQLMVTSNNDPAIRFYERYGFAKTGRTEPYPNDPTLFEFEMMRAV